jgi:F420-non-reducing hydrogenase iron-sulfur subunit
LAEFEPTIIAFCCNYCAFAAADLAGSMRLTYPPNVRIIRLPCSGRADVREVLEALLDGADGVLVVGCMEGDCHFIGGNYKAKRRITRALTLLEESHINPERLAFRNNSAAMGPQLAQLFTEFTERIRELGPNTAKSTTPNHRTEVHP